MSSTDYIKLAEIETDKITFVMPPNNTPTRRFTAKVWFGNYAHGTTTKPLRILLPEAEIKYKLYKPEEEGSKKRGSIISFPDMEEAMQPILDAAAFQFGTMQDPFYKDAGLRLKIRVDDEENPLGKFKRGGFCRLRMEDEHHVKRFVEKDEFKKYFNKGNKIQAVVEPNVAKVGNSTHISFAVVYLKVNHVEDDEVSDIEID